MFGIAYDTLKRQILSGALGPGRHIDINTLTRSIGVSTSPMREALCTLTAEGLVTLAKGSGFHVPAFDYAAIRDLLKWSDLLASQCVKAAGRQESHAVPHGNTDHLSKITALFGRISQMALNGEVAHALVNATQRLHVVYRCEPIFLPDTSNELRRIEEALETGAQGLLRQVHRFHHRRIAILPKIARVVRQNFS